MGRPLSSQFFSDPASAGFQLAFQSAWIPGEAAPNATSYIIKQTGYNKYIAHNSVTGIEGEVQLSDSSATVVTGGTGYTIGQTLTVSGGTGTAATLTVLSVGVSAATVHAAGGGTGYGNAQTFNVTVVGGTGTAAIVNVTSNAGGVVTTVNSITLAGSYVALPTLSGAATTGGTGTGLTLDLTIDVVKSVAIATPGAYTALPANPVSVTVGAATFNLTIGASAAGFASIPVLPFIDGTEALSTVTVATPGTGYVPGTDTANIHGGTGTVPASIKVATTKVVSVALNAAGTGYHPADVITLAGGTGAPAATVTVVTTKVVSATIASAGSGALPDGAAVVTGTTGTGTKFTANVTLSGGAIASVNSIATGGSYTVNPTLLTNEPVVLTGLAGAALNVVMGVNTISLTTGGSYTANAAGGNFTQASVAPTGGTGATFQTGVYGANTITVTASGDYTVLPASPNTPDSTAGAGIGLTVNLVWGAATTAPVYAMQILAHTVKTYEGLIYRWNSDNSYDSSDTQRPQATLQLA